MRGRDYWKLRGKVEEIREKIRNTGIKEWRLEDVNEINDINFLIDHSYVIDRVIDKFLNDLEYCECEYAIKKINYNEKERVLEIDFECIECDTGYYYLFRGME